MLTDLNHLLHLDRSIPMFATVCDDNVLDFASYFTALEKTYPAYLWKEEPAVANLKSLRETYAISQSFFLEHRGSLQRLVFIKAIPESSFQIL